MKNMLTRILEKRNLNYREQCGQQPSWGERRPTILDLEPQALEKCLRDPVGYEKKLWKMGNILFPSASFSAPFALQKTDFPRGFAASVPEGNTFYAKLAKKLGGRIFYDKEKLPADAPMVIFGNSAVNHHAEKLAFRQKVLANGLYPGRGGWSLELPQEKMPTAVISCDEMSEKAFLRHWESKRVPCFSPGPDLPEIFHDPEKMLKEMVSTRIPVKDFDDFTAKVIAAFDCGGPGVSRDNGHRTVTALVRTYYAYGCTGDRRFLESFRTIFFGLVDYHLNFPGGASYLSDYDFYLGSLVNCFAAAETDPVFTTEDRLLGAAFLFSSFRLIEKYGKSYWPLREGTLRFNHETFPAISCYWGARYFGEHYDVKEDARRWKYYAQYCFTEKNLTRCWRQRENSGSYQWIVPSQKLQWDLAEKGKPSPGFKKIPRAISFVSDNNGREICYGDSEPLISRSHKDMLQALAQISGDQLALQLSSRMDSAGASPLPVPGWGHYLHPAPVPAGKWEGPKWQEEALVPHILARYPEAAKSRFDKVLFRTETCCMLFEPCSCDSHRHHDTGAILIYQHGKHLWLVDNGYGFDIRHTPENVCKAYGAREVGPLCHNTLIFRNKDGKIILPPEFPVYRRKGNTITCEITVDGLKWKRELTVLGNGLSCIDTVRTNTKCNAATVECQFNALGRDSLKNNTWALTQKGGRAELVFRDSPGTQVSQDSYLTLGWKAVLGSVYPYASGEIKQLRRIHQVPAPGKTVRFESILTILR